MLTGYLGYTPRNALNLNLASNLTSKSLRLFQNNISPIPQSVVGDFVECNYPGYAAQTTLAPATFHDSGTDNLGLSVNVGTIFNCNSSVSPQQTAYGWYITDSGTAPTTMYGMGVFTPPFNFANTGDGLFVGDIHFTIRPTTGT